eukprot:PhM_4_TR2296/c0_g1_i1/m.70121
MSGRIELLCLGTGKGATAVYTDHPSTAYVVLLDGYPVMMLDMGIGATRSALHHCRGVLPEVVYISHNHLDHSGELPVVVSTEAARGNRLRVVAAPDVMRRLVEHRMAEYHDSLTAASRKVSDLAEFVEAAPWDGTSSSRPTPVVGDFSVLPVLAQHSERCYGAILFYKDRPILGFGADSGYDRSYFVHMMMAPTVILDCRGGQGTYDHASFDDVYDFITSLPPHSTRFLLSHYGHDADADGPPQEMFAPMRNVLMLRRGDVVPLLTGHPRGTGGIVVDSPYEGMPGVGVITTPPPAPMRPPPSNVATTPPSSSSRPVGYGSRPMMMTPPMPQRGDTSALGATSVSPPPKHYHYRLPGQRTPEHHLMGPTASSAIPMTARKIFVHSNEDKTVPGVMVPLQSVRTLQQLKLRVSEMLPNVKPLKGLYTATGRAVGDVDELSHMQELVAVKHAGRPFDPTDLPRGFKITHFR